MSHYEAFEVEADVRGVSGSLDRLAAADRASAAASLEDRAFMASRVGLRAALDATPAARSVGGEAPVLRIGWLLSGLRLAACLAVAGTGVAAWVAVSNRPAAAADTDLVAWLEAYPSGDDGWTELGSRIDALHADLLSVAATLDESDESGDGLGGVGDGEAM